MRLRIGKPAIVLLLIYPFLALPQGPGSFPTITGTVTDAEGAVIPGVEIIAVNMDRYSTLKTITSQAGAFRFAPLAIGHYVINIKSRKWVLQEPVKATVEITSDIKLDLKLEAKRKK